MLHQHRGVHIPEMTELVFVIRFIKLII
jgi:hypothetical protein